MIEFRLPSLGADMDEGKLLEWHVRPGDAVRRGQVIAVVDTSKAAIDIECWQEGTVLRLLTEPQQTVAVGTVMALLLAPGETPETAVLPEVKAGSPAKVPAAAGAVAPAIAGAPAVVESRRKVSPAARRRAAELGVAIDSLPAGTGFGGALTLEDVERAGTAAGPVDRAAAMRATIAAAMSRSKREIPHYYLGDVIPLLKLTQWLEQRNRERPITERILAAVPMIKSVAVALKRFPQFNGFFRDGSFVPSAAIHPGVAIALRQGGLIAPALHDADGKSLDQLMGELGDLIKRARAGSLRSSELADPTLTITALGEQGVESVFGVIYPPQVALVGFGTIASRPWIVDGEVRAVPVVHASLAADHRVSDGHQGARFLAAIGQLLQQPETL